MLSNTWMIYCVSGRPLPYSIVNERTGAMLCCDSNQLPLGEVQSNQGLDSEKKCTLLTPKTSLGLVKEVWSMRNYTWAAGMLNIKLPSTKDFPRLEGCCYEEQFNFTISSHGLSAQTGETRKIAQQDDYVQPTLSLLCVKYDNCHTTGNLKLFQIMEAHSLYVESEDHPEHLQQELILVPSGCLCIPHTQAVKAESGKVLIPMNLIEEATTDSHIVKRNVVHPTELPEVLRLALEIMREPNHLPVLNSVERQMAMQLQQTKYFTMIAMAAGLPGGIPYKPTLPYELNQQGNITQTGMGSLPVEFPFHSYQLILSAFLAGIALGQNFLNISQTEILNRLIVENGDSGINLLETILENQNTSFAYDYNSLVNITNVDSDDNSSNKTYVTDTMVDSTTEKVITPFVRDLTPYAAALVDSTSDAVYHTSYNEVDTTDATPASVIHFDSDDNSSNKTYVDPSTPDPFYHVTTTGETMVDSTTDDNSSNKTFVTPSNADPFYHVTTIGDTMVDSTTENIITSSMLDETPYAAALVDSTSDAVLHTSYNEADTTDATADSVIHVASHEEYITDIVSKIEGSTDTLSNEEYITHSYNLPETPVPEIAHNVFYNEDHTTKAPTMVDSTPDIFSHFLFDEDYGSNLQPLPETGVPEAGFNLTKYIIELPQYKPITINPEHLIHILFAPDPFTNDERGNHV